jgi:hypothetical protein
MFIVIFFLGGWEVPSFAVVTNYLLK